MIQQAVTLNSGYKLPVVGLGTWQSPHGVIGKVIKTALDLGYRHFDCAQCYGNEDEVGEAFEAYFKTSAIKREDIFITSKVWNTHHSFQACSDEVDRILKRLKTPYVDLMLIHWPHGFKEGTGELFPFENGQLQYSDVDYLETWSALEKKVEEGRVRSIGVSNFNIEQIQRVIDNGRIRPAVNEAHLYFQQKELLDYCKNQGIAFIAYAPLGSPERTPVFKKNHPNIRILDDPLVLELAEKYHKTPAQIALRWALQSGTVIIPKSTNESRLKENIDLFDFEINQTDMERLGKIDKGLRLMDSSERDGHHKYYPWAKSNRTQDSIYIQ